MEKFAKISNIIDVFLDNKQRRHLTGGLLLSVSMLFGGLAITVITLKGGDNR